jgi:hypothetical protein
MTVHLAPRTGKCSYRAVTDVRKRFAEQRVAFDGLTSFQLRKKIEPGKVVWFVRSSGGENRRDKIN